MGTDCASLLMNLFITSGNAMQLVSQPQNEFGQEK